MHPSRLFARISAAVAVFTSAALAVPTAVNDAYTTPEDVTVSGNPVDTVILSATFDAGAGNTLPLPALWDYTDTIPAGTTAYPVDEESVSWRMPAFDKTTSSIGIWKSAAMPLQGGTPGPNGGAVDGLPPPNVLLGVTGNNGVNTVNSYLIRGKVTVTAAQAAQAGGWTASVLADDAAIIYINGTEAGRVGWGSFTGGTVNLDSLAEGQGSSETVAVPVPLTVPFVAGENTIAIELHQNANTSSDAGIGLSIAPSSADPLAGLAYVDDVNGTTRPNSAAGALDNGQGQAEPSVNVVLSRGFGGGGSGNNVSGGWRRTISVPNAGTLRIRCDARARATLGMEDNETVEAIVMLDGARLNIEGRNYLVRQAGINPAATPNANGDNIGPWASYTIEVPVTAGPHTIVFGAFGPRYTNEGGGFGDFDEAGIINFDNISVTMAGTAGSLLDNDTGGVAPVTAVKVSDPANGVATVSANGNFSYVPAANWSGTDTFTYKAVDGTGESAPATVTITVDAVNDAPVAVNDGPHVTPQDEPLVVGPEEGVLENDTDVETTALTAVLGTSTGGSTVLNPDGSFTFTPNPGFAGNASFTYRASDGTAQSAPATVTISVTDFPDPPTANNDTYTAVKNTPLAVTAITPGTVTDEVLPFQSADWHYYDSLVLAERNLGTSWRNPDYVESGPNWKTGPAELGYGDNDEATRIEDNGTPGYVDADDNVFATYYFRRTFEVQNPHTVTGVEVTTLHDDSIAFYINGANATRSNGLPSFADMPELAWDFYSTNANNEEATQTWNFPATVLQSGSNLIAAEVHQTNATSSDVTFDLRLRLQRATAAGVLANDTDPDPGQAATLVAEIVAQPGHGAVTLNSNGTFTYTPANGYVGPDSFTYRAKDTTNLTSAIATANLTVVTGPNVPPVAVPDTYFTTEDTPLNVTAAASGLLQNDTDAEGDPITAVIASQPLKGTVTLNANGTFLYTPNANANGTDSFTYRASDGRPSAPATVTIEVEGENDAPVALADTYSGDPGVPFTVAAAQGVLANDTDVDTGTTLTAVLVAPPATGSFTLNDDGSFTYTVAQGGTYTFTYRARDGTANSNIVTVTIRLNAVPVTQPDSYTLDEDGALTPAAGVLANDSDPEGQLLAAALVANVQHGTLALQSAGGFTYTPATNYFGPDSFTYTATDGVRTSAPVTVSLTVEAVNDAPVAVGDTYGVRVDTTLDITAANGVLRNDSDVDNTALTVALIAPPVDGTLVLNPDGSFSYSPAAGFSGSRSFTYRVSDGTLQSAVVTVTLNVSTALNTIAISEIMYNPPGTAGALEEFVEIYNFGDAAVDLTGWAFTKGVDYAFPNGTLIPGRAYLAVPANSAAFAAKYPDVTAVTSAAWGTAGGTLGNGGELVRLKNAADETVDEVDYSDEGDWAVRRLVGIWDATNTPGAAPRPVGTLDTDPGLEWITIAEPDLNIGLGSDPNMQIGNFGGGSLQLVNFNLTNNAGQNWGAAMPTPGAPNSAALVQSNSAPLIRDVAHSPAVPNRTQQVFVTARITDELLTGSSASAFYRTWQPQGTAPDGTGEFTEVVMADNGLRGDGLAGDGVFGAVIPAQAIDTVVEFYVRAVDAGGNARTWPGPTLDIDGTIFSQNANCLYQVNEEVWTDHRSLYQLVLTGADNAAFNAGLNDRTTNAGRNCTVIFRQGGRTDVRYLGTIRPRGNSSRTENNTPMNLRMDIPGDKPWNGRTAFTLNYKYSYSQYLGSRLLECAGVPCELAGVVGMRLNGLNRLLVQANGQPGPSGVRAFGYYCDLIPRGGDVVNHWFPDDNDGNAYGKIRAGFGGARWLVSTLPTLHPVAGYAVGGYVNEGYTKQTNGAQNDWTDVHAWMQSLQLGLADGSDFHTHIASTVDIDQWCRLLAVATIINHGETNMTNGDDDDYSLYFGADRKCRIIPHDLDTCFNLNAIGLGDETAPPNVTIYQCTDPNFIDGATLTQMDKFYRNPVTGRKFKAELRRYLDTLFLKPNFDATVDRLLDSQWMGNQFTPNGDAIRTHIKTFLDQRRATIETFLPTAFTAATTLAVQNGVPRSTSATDLGALGGKIDPARTAEVRVNGIKATTNPYGSTGATDNSWSAGTAVTLAPGLNTLVCTAHDEAGAVFATQTVSIWYDAPGVNKSGTLAASETWSAAGGPYNIIASVTVPNNIVLTIEPGATVFVAPGTGLNITGGGRIFAQGTAAAGIRFQTNPAAAGTWNGITISGATAEASVISYATFANNGDTAVHAQNGANVVLNHLTFLNPGEQFIEVDASSFYISDCVFPSSTAAFEPVHGSGGIAAGGRGIIERCTFGKTMGYNDSIDFTGGNRPGPILHIRDCTFAGSDDDILDLDSTDAWIERCVFMHAHRNGSPDSASAVSGGADTADASQITVLNCLFYDCDNAVTMKQGNQPNGNSAALLYNTIVHTTKTGGEDPASGVVNFDDVDVNGEGKGFHLEGNIIWDAESLTRNWVPANSALVLTNNWLPSAPPAEATSTGNRTGDPLLNLALIPNPAAATVAQVVAALHPLACSPALGLGADMDIAHRSIRVSAPPASVWPADVTLAVGPGGSLTPTGQPAWAFGFTHYKYVLDGGGESAEFSIATPLALTGLAAGNHTLAIIAKDDSGVWVDGGYALAFYVAADAPTVVLSEVLAAPAAGEEFIELHNYGTASASLAGCKLLTADSLPSEIYMFPAGTTIPAGGRMVLDGTQLAFNLNRSGETIILRSPGNADLDTVTFGPQITGMSIARVANAWALSTPTPAAANTGACELGTGALVRINEWLGSNDLIVAGDFVELYNGEGKPVNLAAWNITDDFRNEADANEFPPLSFIPASGFLELIADGDRAAGSDHLDFKVSRLRDDITLLNAAGTLVDHAYVLPGNPDVSQGRTPDGSATAAYLALPTPGFSNSTDLTTDTAVMNSLRITELMFDPPAGGPEFIEFKNIGTENLTTTGVTFANGITFTFPVTTLAAGGYAVITNDIAAFNARYPGVPATQWTGGRLDNNGETLRIETGGAGLGILDFRYEGNWYPETRSGASLELVNPAAPRSTWGDKASWQPCVASPGGPSAFGVVAPADLTIAPGGTAILHGFVCPGSHAIGSITVAWSKVSGPGDVNFTAPANRDTDASFTAPGVYELRLTATPPGGAPDASDTVLVTVAQPFESYADWTARTLAGFPPAQQAGDADADNDGVPNAVEHVIGTDPAAPSAGPELIINGGKLALRYNVADNIDPAIQIIPQISDALGNWQTGPGFLTISAAGTVHTATDVNNLGASVKKFMRLKVVLPQL